MFSTFVYSKSTKLNVLYNSLYKETYFNFIRDNFWRCVFIIIIPVRGLAGADSGRLSKTICCCCCCYCDTAGCFLVPAYGGARPALRLEFLIGIKFGNAAATDATLHTLQQVYTHTHTHTNIYTTLWEKNEFCVEHDTTMNVDYVGNGVIMSVMCRA